MSGTRGNACSTSCGGALPSFELYQVLLSLLPARPKLKTPSWVTAPERSISTHCPAVAGPIDPSGGPVRAGALLAVRPVSTHGVVVPR
jgi:hypothetical protein